MTRQELEQWTVRHGYVKDRYGHYQRQTENRSVRRIKLSRVSVRLEVKSGHGWVRLRSGYYKNISLNDNDQLCGLTL